MNQLQPVSFRKPVKHEPRLSAPYVAGKHSERFWTARENHILEKHYPRGGAAPCLAELKNRTLLGVYQQAQKLGLSAARVERIKAPEGFDDTLRLFYQTGDGKKRGECNAFADRYDLPRWWVTKRAQRLGLLMPHKKEPPWTARELALIKTLPLHDVEKSAEIMRQHGFARSPTAIMVKAKRLDLSRRYRETLSATSAARILGIDAKSITREILQGDLKAEKRKTKRLAQQGGDPWSIAPANLRRYIIDHLERVDLRKVDKFAFVQVLAAEPIDRVKSQSAQQGKSV